MIYSRPDLARASHALNARACTAVSQRADRGGCGCGDALRHVGRSSFGVRLSAVLAGADARRVGRACADRDGRRIPSIVFTKGGGTWLDEIASCGADGVGLDWTVDIAAARAAVGSRVALQGNLDPQVLLTDAATVTREPRPSCALRGRRRATSSTWGTASFQALRQTTSQRLYKLYTPPRGNPRRCLIRAAHARGNRRKPAPVLAIRGLDKGGRPHSSGAVMHTNGVLAHRDGTPVAAGRRWAQPVEIQMLSRIAAGGGAHGGVPAS
jgi:uroporphyrinogen decarboxylase